VASAAKVASRSSTTSPAPRKAPTFYALVLLGTLGGATLTLFGINPIRLLVFVAVINGVAAAPFLVLVMLVSSDKKIIGDYANGQGRSGRSWWSLRSGRRSSGPIAHRLASVSCWTHRTGSSTTANSRGRSRPRAPAGRWVGRHEHAVELDLWRVEEVDRAAAADPSISSGPRLVNQAARISTTR
jgi:hypothetical protein